MSREVNPARSKIWESPIGECCRCRLVSACLLAPLMMSLEGRGDMPPRGMIASCCITEDRTRLIALPIFFLVQQRVSGMRALLVLFSSHQ